MMPLRRFAIHQPENLAEASGLLAQYGEKARLYAGGTELLLAMKHDLLRYERLVDIKTVPGLDQIEVRDGHLCIGASVTHRSIEGSPLVKEKVPALAKMAANIANVRVRTTGTLGGNLCFAEPHSDPATLLLCLEARARVQGKSEEKTLTMDQLIVGAYDTALAADELLTAVEIPLSSNNQRASYLKFQVHERPLLGLGLVLDLDEDGRAVSKARTAVGSVSPKPCRSEKVEALMVGSLDEVEKKLADAAPALADSADLVDDLEGSAEYKRHLIGVFLRRAFAKALSRPPTG